MYLVHIFFASVLFAYRVPVAGLRPLDTRLPARTTMVTDGANSANVGFSETTAFSETTDYSTAVWSQVIQLTRILKPARETRPQDPICEVIQLTMTGQVDLATITNTINLINEKLCDLPQCKDHNPLALIHHHHEESKSATGIRTTQIVSSICDAGCLEALSRTVGDPCWEPEAKVLSVGLPDQTLTGRSLPCANSDRIPNCLNYACVNQRTMCLQCESDFIPNQDYTLCVTALCPPISAESSCTNTVSNRAYCGFQHIYQGSLCGSQTIVSVCPQSHCPCIHQNQLVASSLVGFTECRDCSATPVPSASSTPARSNSPSASSTPLPSQVLAGTGSVSGRVVNELGRPLANVEVRLLPVRSERRRDVLDSTATNIELLTSMPWFKRDKNDCGSVSTDTNRWYGSSTDNDGQYTMTNVPENEYVASYTLDVGNYVDVGNSNRLCITVLEGVPSSMPGVAIIPSGSISGSVVDANGLPIGGAMVNLYSNTATLITNFITTVSTGAYSFYDLVEGDYQIELVVSSIGDGDFRVLNDPAETDLSRLPVRVSSSEGFEAVAQQNFILGRIGTIYGSLKQAGTNAVVSSASVSLRVDAQTRNVSTSSEGLFSFTEIGFVSGVLAVPDSTSLGVLVSPNSSEIHFVLDMDTPTRKFEMIYAPTSFFTTMTFTAAPVSPSSSPTPFTTSTPSSTAGTIAIPFISAIATPSPTPSPSPTLSKSNGLINSAIHSATSNLKQSPTTTASASTTTSLSVTPSATASLTLTASITSMHTPSTTQSASTLASISVTASTTNFPSSTPSATITSSVTASQSSVKTVSITPQASTTPTMTASASTTTSVSVTPSATTSLTLPASISSIHTPSTTQSASILASKSVTASTSNFPSSTPSATITSSVTASQSSVKTVSITPQASTTPTMTASASTTTSLSVTPSATASLTLTASITSMHTPSTTQSASTLASISVTASTTNFPSNTPSATITSSVTASQSSVKTASVTPQKSASISANPSVTPSVTAEVSATATTSSTNTPASIPSASSTISPSPSMSRSGGTVRGWILAGVNAGCFAACSDPNYSCNDDRMDELNTQSEVGSIVQSLGGSCTSYSSSFINPLSIDGSGVCYFATTFPTYTCFSGLSGHKSICCCGADSDCPIPTPSPDPSARGWVLASEYVNCDAACSNPSYSCNSARMDELDTEAEVSYVVQSLGESCTSFEESFVESSVHIDENGRCTYANVNPDYVCDGLALLENRRICCCGTDSDCPRSANDAYLLGF